MISIVIPTKNEPNVGSIIKSLPRRIDDKKTETIVVDASTDTTASSARRAGARVIAQKGTGKGAAMREGARAAHGEIIVFMDGDGSHPAEYIPRLVKLLEDADVAVGTQWFPQTLKISSLKSRLFGAPYILLARLLIKRSGFRTTEPITGFRAMRKSTFEMLGTKADGFLIETEMEIAAIRNNLTIAEIGIPLNARVRGSKFLRSPRQWLKIIRYISSHRNILAKRARISFDGTCRFVDYSSN